MKVWRIAKAKHADTVENMLSGRGAKQFGGRWNPKGMRAVYCSENSSLAALEILARLVSPSTFPKSYKVMDLDVPDDAIFDVPDDAIMEAPEVDDAEERVGAVLLRKHLAIKVRSAVNPLECNIVINPEHQDFDKVIATDDSIRPFVFDDRRGQRQRNRR